MNVDLVSTDAFLSVLDASFDPIGIVDRDDLYVWINDASIGLFGYPRDEVIGTHFRERVLPGQPATEVMQHALHGNASSDGCNARTTGSWCCGQN